MESILSIMIGVCLGSLSASAVIIAIWYICYDKIMRFIMKKTEQHLEELEEEYY